MILDVFPRESREAGQRDAAGALAGPAPTLGEAYEIAWNNARRFQNMLAREQSRIDAYQRVAEDFYKVSGHRVEGAHAPFAGNMIDPQGKFEAYRGAGGRLRKAVDEFNKNNPDRAFALPSDEEIGRQAFQMQREARRADQELDLRPGSWAASIGGFVGAAAGVMTDLPNVLTAPFGGSGSLVRLGLTEFALGAGSTAVSEAVSFENKQKVDPNYTASEAVANVAFGGLAQAGFVVGARAAGMGIGALASRFNANRTQADRALADAGNVTMGEAVMDARTPPRAMPEARALHTETAIKAVDDMYASRPVTPPPPSLLLETGARTGRVFDADNVGVDVRYEVAELRDLVTSHTDDFVENPAFPLGLQPRDRARALSQEQVLGIANNLVPERLGPSMDASTGAPIASVDGIVESGNGRVMALRRAYAMNGPQAQAYRDYLRSQRFDVDGFEQPVLVARRMSAMDEAGRQRFVGAANRSSALRMSATEQAIADAKLMDGAALSRLQPGPVTSAANKDFVRAFAARLNRGEQGAMFDADGVLSQDGARRLQGALAARAYMDPAFMGRLLEDTDSNIKAIGGAMSDAAGPMARLQDMIARGEVPPHMDLTPDLMDAVRLVMRARDEGRLIREMVAQGDLLFEASPMTATLLRAMFRDDEFKKPIARKALAELLTDFADEAAKVKTDPLLFGEPAGRQDVLGAAVRMQDRRDLDVMLAQRLDPEAVREAARAPEAQDAVVQEAYRLASADNRVVLVDFEGKARPVDDVLMELDDMAKAAKELEACATGRTAAE